MKELSGVSVTYRVSSMNELSGVKYEGTIMCQV